MSGVFILGSYAVLVLACGWWGLAAAGLHLLVLLVAAWLKG